MAETKNKAYKTFVSIDGLRQAFYQPYSGCSPNHTYLYFLYDYVNNGGQVYFYNPNFPDRTDDAAFDEYLEQAIVDSLDDTRIITILEEMHYHHLVRKANCDWREIIFQMAKDYRRHMHEDDFLLKVRETNGCNRHGE